MENSAVEWLVNELKEKFPTRLKSMYNSNQLLLESLVVKAKEMEKQQKISLLEWIR